MKEFSISVSIITILLILSLIDIKDKTADMVCATYGGYYTQDLKGNYVCKERLKYE